MKRIIMATNAQPLRNQLLAYLILEEINLEELIEVVAVTNMYFYNDPHGCQ